MISQSWQYHAYNSHLTFANGGSPLSLIRHFGALRLWKGRNRGLVAIRVFLSVPIDDPGDNLGKCIRVSQSFFGRIDSGDVFQADQVEKFMCNHVAPQILGRKGQTRVEKWLADADARIGLISVCCSKGCPVV